MEEKDKKALVGLQVEKAKRFLSQADEMVELKHWDLAANRYYYACFHAVQGLFIHKGINAHTHAGIISPQLYQSYIEPNFITKNLWHSNQK